MSINNSVQISGKIRKVYPLKYTLLNLPVVSFVLEHASEQLELDVLRKVNCSLYCIMLDKKKIVANLDDLLGQLVTVSGFLSYNAKKQIILNVQTLQLAKD